MRRILKRHEVLADEWRLFGEDAPDGAGDSDALIVPLAASYWNGWPRLSGPAWCAPMTAHDSWSSGTR